MESVIHSNKMKLALGTVQFGLNYGVTNTIGKVDESEVIHILALAKSLGIKTLDCASVYGSSEKILGSIDASKHFDIVTKVPRLCEEFDPNYSVEHYLQQSLTQLRAQKIYALMFHDADDLLSPHAKINYQQIKDIKKRHLIKKFGVSVYNPYQLESILDDFDLDIIQIPLNCLDQRFLHKSVKQRLASQKIEVHARSLFLQGILLMPFEKLSEYFQPFRAELLKFHNLYQNLNCHPLTLALSIIHENELVDKVVVGCCSAAQLAQIAEHYHLAETLLINQGEQLMDLACDKESLINPSLWEV